jgi:hypothetical protein
MKSLKEMSLEAVKEYFKSLTTLFKPTGCDCPKPDEDDHMGGKIFKHYKNGNLYRFLFTATLKGHVKEDLMVIYQDIESGRRHARRWNDFFSSTKVDGVEVPRFEEQK